ncbi:hypothetical protein [uncultured Amnibacterium sp.]|uniref:hypothetical protein n=1 Tax=uncultured Amnibacterium sp. TaxID=1631851 RepID=UPI0035CBFDB2
MLLTVAIAAVGLVLATTLALHALVSPANDGSLTDRIGYVTVSHDETSAPER